MVEGDEEIAQGVMMNLAIRKDEFEFDEFIGLDRDFMENKPIDEEVAVENILSALQIMTDQEIIEGADTFEITEGENRQANISLRAIKADGESINVGRS